MVNDFEGYARLAQDDLYSLAQTDGEDVRAEQIAKGQAWALLALAAAVHELAEAQR